MGSFGQQHKRAYTVISSSEKTPSYTNAINVADNTSSGVAQVQSQASTPKATKTTHADEERYTHARVVFDLSEIAPVGSVVLFAGFGSSLKTAVHIARGEGFALHVTATEDKRRSFAFSGAAEPVCIGQKFDERLFSNAYAVLGAAHEISAASIVVCSGTLADNDVFLAGAAAAGIRVFSHLEGDVSMRFWVECFADTNALTFDENVWRRCPQCGLMHDYHSIATAATHCPSCDALYRITSDERIAITFDENTFQEWDTDLPEPDPLNFPGYKAALEKQRERTGLSEAVRCGRAELAGLAIATCIMDSAFMMGSMGTVVGEKITRTVERATEQRLPLLIFTASGGARMQEGLASLMQMAKISAALSRHADAGLFYVAVITDPTTGGVTASFAMQGDVIIAEPGALIGFAGRRVIQDTIRETLPDDFQTAEFALTHGLIDAVIAREELRSYLAHLVAQHLASRPSMQGGVVLSYEAVESRLELGTAYSSVSIAPDAIAAAHGIETPVQWLRTKRRERKRALHHADALRAGDETLAGVFGHARLDTHKEADNDGRAWESVQLARNTHRPTARYYIDTLVKGFCELHGDRHFLDDAAIIAGIGWIGRRPVTILAEERGRDLTERVKRNFGCPRPEGYRKTLRLMKQAERFRRSIICIVDTQGAFCGAEAEKRGIGGAIADNLRAMASLRVPVVAVFIGEGGSGGALALAVANRIGMLEHAVYSILSPEGFASILWKDASRAAEAAGVMGMDATSVHKLGIVDEVISEGPQPAHENPEIAARNVGAFIERCLDELESLSGDELADARYRRFRAF